jgi:hypothetical protein
VLSPRTAKEIERWRDRAAKMRALAVTMGNTEAGILLTDLADHYDELADQAALEAKSTLNGKSR